MLGSHLKSHEELLSFTALLHFVTFSFNQRFITNKVKIGKIWMCHIALLIKVVILNFVHAFLKSAESTTATFLLTTSPLFLCKNKELFHVVIYLLLSRVQAQGFDQPWRVNVLPVAVLQECKQILQMLTDGLGLIIWKRQYVSQTIKYSAEKT